MPASVLAALSSGLAAAFLLALNVVPRHGAIVSSDEGAWPGSWRREYGWPSTAYTEFGYDAATGMRFWTPEGLATDALLASAAVGIAGILALGLAKRPSSPGS